MAPIRPDEGGVDGNPVDQADYPTAAPAKGGEARDNAQESANEAQELPTAQHEDVADEEDTSAETTGVSTNVVPAESAPSRNSAPHSGVQPDETSDEARLQANVPRLVPGSALQVRSPSRDHGQESRALPESERSKSAARISGPMNTGTDSIQRREPIVLKEQPPAPAPDEHKRSFVSAGKAGESPAVSRAEQVEHMLRIESAAGQTTQHPDAARAQSGSTGLQQPLHGADMRAMSAQQIAPQVNAQNAAGSAQGGVRPLEESPATSRIIRGLTTMINQRGGSLSMRLDPPDLGALRIQMTIVRGVVNAQLVASTAQAHGLLENSLATLRAALEGQGLAVERLSVQMQPSSQQNQQHYQDGSARNDQDGQHHPDAGEGQSRGRRDGERAAGQSGKSAVTPNGFGAVMEGVMPFNEE